MVIGNIRSNDSFHYPFFVKGDIDGFIGLFIDNLINLLIISGLCLSAGMPADLVFGTILPGTAFSVLSGNIFYSFQARKLAKKEKRTDVTALPYGINTVSLFAFFNLIILPVMIQTRDPMLAWKAGVISCFICGIFEGLGAFVGDRIRKISPRAALLSTLAGIAIVFIALEHTIKIWEKPVIAFVPLAFILIEYFSKTKLPFNIPAGFYAILTGSIIAWSMGAMDWNTLVQSTKSISFNFPGLAISEIFSFSDFEQVLPFLSISIPMGIMSFFGTLQNIESASAAGDNFPAKPALAMNGIGTIIGSFFGSPFPTTVYIGHPGWKGLGARTGYSIINGAVMTFICLSGLMSVISALIPMEAGYPILLWIGVIITAQAFQTTPWEHAPAVALGLMPSISAWGLNLLHQFIKRTGTYSTEQANGIIVNTLPHLKGLLYFSEGALLSSMLLAGISVYLIEKNFLLAFYWTIPLIILSFFGFIHSSDIGIGKTGNIPIGYALFGTVLILVYFYNRTITKKFK